MGYIIFCSHQTTDGGYILGGTSNFSYFRDKWENCLGSEDYLDRKNKWIGIIQWQNTIGGVVENH
jgi:hypothetical protein